MERAEEADGGVVSPGALPLQRAGVWASRGSRDPAGETNDNVRFTAAVLGADGVGIGELVGSGGTGGDAARIESDAFAAAVASMFGGGLGVRFARADSGTQSLEESRERGLK